MGRSKHSGDRAEEYKTGSVQKATKQIKERQKKVKSRTDCAMKGMEYDAKTGKCV